MPRERVCRYCGFPIRWACTPLGHRLALDASSDPDGNVQIVHGAAVFLSVEEALRKRSQGYLLFQRHVCAGAHGKRRAGMPEREKQRMQQRRAARERKRLNEMTKNHKATAR